MLRASHKKPLAKLVELICFQQNAISHAIIWLFRPNIKHERRDVMAKSLAHTKYMCKYHIVFIPKFRKKVIYNKLRADTKIYTRLM